MSETLIIALVSLTGSLIGTFGGILTSAKLTNYRIQQLEHKVDKHNNFAERIPVLESRLDTIGEHVTELDKYILKTKED